MIGECVRAGFAAVGPLPPPGLLHGFFVDGCGVTAGEVGDSVASIMLFKSDVTAAEIVGVDVAGGLVSQSFVQIAESSQYVSPGPQKPYLLLQWSF